MFNRKEIISILVASVFLAFSISLVKLLNSGDVWNIFLYVLISVLIVILINSLAKKIAAFFFESEVEIKLWEFQRYGFKRNQKTKLPFPAGIFFPIFSAIILFPFKGIVWMASLVFDVKPKPWRVAKRHGYYSFSEMTEDHIGYIAAAGIIVNLFFAVIGYLIGYPLFSKINIWFALFNMIPISELDGNKIFFGNLTLWSILAIITLLGLGYSIFLV
jgi:Zn-dependent protease